MRIVGRSPSVTFASAAFAIAGARRSNRYFLPGFRSLDKRLTMSEAVRSISLESIPLLGSNTDHNTWRDFTSTRKTVPRPFPNVLRGVATPARDSGSDIIATMDGGGPTA